MQEQMFQETEREETPGFEYTDCNRQLDDDEENKSIAFNSDATTDFGEDDRVHDFDDHEDLLEAGEVERQFYEEP
jgi:hypothetical protein